MNHYTYVYLDWNFVPYYVGKGINGRCFARKKHPVPIPPPVRILRFNHATKEEAYADEKRLVALYGRIDLGTGILMNLTDGGPGCPNLCEQSRQKIRDYLKRHHPFRGKPLPEAWRLAISKAGVGRIRSVDTRKKLSDALKGVKKSPEAVQRQVESRLQNGNTGWTEERRQEQSERLTTSHPMRGRHFSSDARERIRLGAQNRKPMSEETRYKISAAGKGRVFSLEHKQRISDALKGKAKTPQHVANSTEARRLRRQQQADS